jgi:hypothetical protein
MIQYRDAEKKSVSQETFLGFRFTAPLIQSIPLKNVQAIVDGHVGDSLEAFLASVPSVNFGRDSSDTSTSSLSYSGALYHVLDAGEPCLHRVSSIDTGSHVAPRRALVTYRCSASLAPSEFAMSTSEITNCIHHFVVYTAQICVGLE